MVLFLWERKRKLAMVKKLRKELKRLSTEILAAGEDVDIDRLYAQSRGIYERLTVLKFMDEKLSDVKVDVENHSMATRFEKVANSVLSGNTSVPESNPHEEDIMTPGMETIKDIVSEMPPEIALENFFAEFVAKPDHAKNDREDVGGKEGERPKSLNDRMGKSFQIGLNDKLAFVKHLFDNNVEGYNRVLSQLVTIDSQERSIAFINNMVKPEYNNWEKKEEYEDRFIALIERRFS